MSSIYIGEYNTSGSSNSFYIVPGNRFGKKRIGFKEFECIEKAKFAYKVQSILAEKDLAPKVYGEVGRISYGGADGLPNGLSGYGYLTEIARPVGDCDDDECGGECYDTGCSNSTEFLNIVSMLEHYGLTYTDYHRANFGYIRRNKRDVMVVIDVGIESFDDWDTDIYGDYDNDGGYDSGNTCSCTVCQVIKAKNNG